MKSFFPVLHLTFFALLILFCRCRPAPVSTENSTVTTEKPEWLKRQIRAFETEKPANPPVTIYRYRYQNQIVYFISGRCCDIPGQVFNVEGQQLCQPDGGITGRGDGKCPDFFETRTDEILVWKDIRK